MTDLIERSKVIEAVEGERLNECTGTECDAAYELALDDAIKAIRALPAASITDEMAANAVRAYVGAGKRGVIDLHEAIRAAIESAIGHGK